ncbi:hypothetical protein BX666DRAFT_1856754 [Dichotomocladium elegans]|nr:hypothetical protein BX666DRAFT_1856754 [Dichotomocladium elegans]
MTRYSIIDDNDQLPLLEPGPKPQSRKKQPRWTIAAAATLVVFGLTSVYLSRHLPAAVSISQETSAQGLWPKTRPEVIAPGISLASFEYGLTQCELAKTPKVNPPSPRTSNPRSAMTNSTLLIKNGHLWLGDKYFDGDILVEQGVIREIRRGIVVDEESRVIDAGGRVVTPGIVDMHSHMSVDSFPGLWALTDENEMTHPTTPYVRVIDAINPGDPALKVVASGGITTSLILPGSGNLMGGEAAVIKLRPVPTLSGQDMLITAGVKDEERIWRYMKMACGENPKAVYGQEQNKMPMTRMGENYLFRQRFQEAQSLLRAQDDWCDAAYRINKTLPTHKPIDEDKLTRLSERFPENLKLESLVALLRHKTKLNIHCYLPQDLEAMVQHSLEFDFEIAAFHHALSAWQVPEVIKRAKTNITVATFADMWGYKHEAWEQNVHAPNILNKAGIPVAFKSDHPVMNARDLVHEAQKAYHYGFDEHLALQALTSVPAAALALSHRIGSLEPGKDADIVIWNRHPLRLGARPKHVIIDGAEMDFQASWTKSVEEEESRLEKPNMDVTTPENNIEKDTPSWLPPRPTTTMRLEDHGLNNPVVLSEACTPETDSFVLRNISRLYMGPGQTLTGFLSIVIENGTILCAGDKCDRDHVNWPVGSPVFEMGGSTVIPGIVSSGAPIGLAEIMSEDSTMDGYAKNDIADPDLAKKVVRAVDGLKLNGLRLQKAYRAGVTTAISQPMSYNELLAGVSVAFRTGVEATLLDSNDTIIEQEAALHFSINHGASTTVSQQIAGIRELLLAHKSKNDNSDVFARAAQGQIPVVVETNGKDEIASIVHMKRSVLQDVKFVILGGAEAYVVAKHLAQAEIAVVLMPARCYAATWQQRLCLYGPPITLDTALDILIRHGVKVALASTDSENGDARNLIWEAGWNLAHNNALTEEDAVGLVTWNLASMFGLSEKGSFETGAKADFVAYNSNPFEFGTEVLMVYGGAHRGPLCFPKQV